MTARNARWLHAVDAVFMSACAVVFGSRAISVLLADGSSTRILIGYAVMSLLAQLLAVIHTNLAVAE